MLKNLSAIRHLQGTLFCLSLLFIQSSLYAQIDAKSLSQLEFIIDSVIQANLESQDIPGTAYILVDKEKTLLKKGFGFTGVDENKKKVSPDSTIFRIGSITKTFSAAAVLHLADKGLIDLDTDVNKYLTSTRVPNTFDQAITPRHLITHSSGFDEIGGRVVFDSEALIPLGDFLNDHLVRLRQPGVVSSYSSYASALAGLLVEDVSNQSLETFLKENFWNPLDMDMTSMRIPPEQLEYVSMGHEIENGRNVEQPWEWYHTYPASEINSTTANMGNYMKMLLNAGKFGGKSVLEEELAMGMRTQQLSTHPEVDGFAFGFYQRTRFGVESFCHGGDMLGYSSFLSLLPEQGIGLFIISHHEGGSLRMRVNDAMMAYFGTNPEEITSHEAKGEDLNKFAGEYQWMTFCHTCENGYQPQGRSITVNADNTLSGFGRRFYQLKPLLFKSFDGQRTMGFIEDEKGKIKYMSLGNINTFEKIE